MDYEFPQRHAEHHGGSTQSGNEKLREKAEKEGSKRERSKLKRASEDILLCCTRLSNLTHTLLNGVLSRLNPTGPLYIAMNSLIQTNSMPENV